MATFVFWATKTVKNGTERLKNGAERLRNETKRLKKAGKRLKNAAERLRNATKRLKNGTERLKNAAKRLKKAAKRLKKMKKLTVFSPFSSHAVYSHFPQAAFSQIFTVNGPNQLPPPSNCHGFDELSRPDLTHSQHYRGYCFVLNNP